MMYLKHSLAIGVAAIGLLLANGSAIAQTVLFSDSFSRVAGTPDENGQNEGVPNPLASTSWGANDNALGGNISQTYEIGPDIRAGNRHQYVDGDLARFRAGWAEIQHDFAADSRTTAGGGIRIEFDATIADLSAGWMSLSVGQTSAESTDVGDNNSVFLMVEDTVDFGVLFGGINGGGVPTILEIFRPGDDPNAFVPSFSGDWGQGTDPNEEQSFRIDIATTGFAVGGTSALANIYVTSSVLGSPVTRHVLTDYAFTWDNDGEAYIGFSSNKDQGCGPDCQDPDQEVRIDNLVISTLNTVQTNNPGDFNGDGKVDNGDLNLLLGNWGSPSVPAAWVNGFVTPVDNGELNALLGNWGFGVGVAVPEPSALMLSLLGLATCARRRR
ncbi:PEP-CTERM sorting domain-containing protein [Botrimarina hoheduenensis]|uniref:PEP-CTERM protein-sorting domain-containing protein n=1 Tax=Botrimarina hoheduenensis TaxID=2528000 RepID=A0A5C5VZJ0_9BACT|nr:PEP-CTERM sorting domain-containing protein [Botrimarina hoheduenensis]TWT42892.1 hypothetical protein Pla111_25300 [Botrimarina hoheduenensis]